ncbi:hypothetical protein ACF1BU_23785 [Streptomyces sp. NPDC014724]
MGCRPGPSGQDADHPGSSLLDADVREVLMALLARESHPAPSPDSC